MSEKTVTLVVPCYNEEGTIPVFYGTVKEVLDSDCDIDYRILFVNDGSTDHTLEEMKKLSTLDSRVQYVSFSRNFGKEAALFAGLCNAEGDYVGVMDVDLQDPPSLIPEMISALESGEYDCAAARRADRKGEPKVRSFQNITMNALTGVFRNERHSAFLTVTPYVGGFSPFSGFGGMFLSVTNVFHLL